MTQDAETVARLESLAVDQRYRYERGDDPHPKQLQCAEALEAGIASIRSLSARLAAAEAREADPRQIELAAMRIWYAYAASPLNHEVMPGEPTDWRIWQDVPEPMKERCRVYARAALQPGAPDANGETK